MKHSDAEICISKRGSNSCSTVASESPIYSVVSMFSGCGGLDLGFLGQFEFRGDFYPKLPFKIIKAYDNEAACAETYVANIGPHIEVADLAKLGTDAMPAADVLIGGFPCQEFSICGPKGGVGAERGLLYRAMVRYASVHRPKVIVAENVAHLPRINAGKDLARIRRAFSRAGYSSQLWNVAAADYGVPQARQRVILIFVRRDCNLQVDIPLAPYAHSHRSARWAIADLESISDETVPNQSQYFRAALAKSGNGQGDEITKGDAPGYTVRANAKSRVQFHYSLNRRLTVRECARLQTFPDSFVFPHAATTNIRQIGNAVPPVLAHYVASAVATALHAQHKPSIIKKNGARHG